MILQQGRPADCTGRLPKETRVYDFLDKLGVDYQRIDHPAATTMEICAQLDAVLGAHICKNLLLCNRQCTKFYLLILPGDKVFKTKELSKQIGSSRLSFATGEHMEALLDITPGSLSLLGLMNDKENKVQLLIDEELLAAQTVGVHPCVNTSSLMLKMQDLLNVILPAMHHGYTAVSLPRSED